jgi:hypothetical protein
MSESLEPVFAASRARLSALELELAARERALAARSAALQALQTRYLAAMGGAYAELIEIESAAIAIEIQLGLRPAIDPAERPEEASAAGDDDPSAARMAASCGPRAAPSADLKRIFRALAKTIHPDLALDDPARWRRHSLMAEANRAYAEQDEDRLRLILHTWERQADALAEMDADAGEARAVERIVAIEARLLAIHTEFADLDASAIGALERKIEDARAQGWDLLAEMVLEVKREVSRAKARLASLRRSSART